MLTDTAPSFQPFGFAGGVYDHRSALVLFGFRSYDPFSGRFLTRDPLWHGGGHSNLYLYVANDPVNFVDPNGLLPVLAVPIAKLLLATYIGTGVSSIYHASQGNYDTVSHQIWSGPSVIAGSIISVFPHALKKWSTGSSVDWDTDKDTIIVYDNELQKSAGFTTTWGNLICYTYSRNDMENPNSKMYLTAQNTRSHEFEHVKQSAYLGPLYLPAHVLAGSISMLTTGKWHNGNFLEAGPMSNPMKPWPW